MVFPLDKVVQDSLAQSVSPPKGELDGLHLVQFLSYAGLNMYPWWSPARDRQLRSFWKSSDHLSGAIYTLESKMSAIPVRVKARDQTNKEDVKQAEIETYRLLAGAQWGEGWPAFYEMFVEDLIGQDNGACAEVIGAGPADGAIVGRPVTVRHLDAGQCQRTGNPVYPILYQESNGKLFKLHYTRVLFRSQMQSTIEEMHGVGFCGVSRAINVAQNLIDILTYKQEKLGSRPQRGVMVTKGGLDPNDVASAFRIVHSEMDSMSLSRYSKIAVVGNATLPEAGLELIDLAGLPDNFDERTSMELGIAVIALAFGMDARELFPALTSGATRAEALIQHLKQRGKGPGQIIQMTETLFNNKYLPPHLELVFDFQDDEQDRQTAETKEIRGRSWSAKIQSGIIDARTARQQMVEVGDLEQGQYEMLELSEGRLPDGASVLALFFTEDKKIKAMLDLGVGEFDPFDIATQDPATFLPAIHKKMGEAQTIMVNSKDNGERMQAARAFAALQELERQLLPPPLPTKPGEETQDDGQVEHDNRMRRVDLARPTQPPPEDEDYEYDRDEERLKGDGTDREFPFDMLLKTLAGYRLNIRSAVRGLWSGAYNYFEFWQAMMDAIRVGFTQAWNEGLRIGGIEPSEQTDAEKLRLQTEIMQESTFIDRFANAIETHSRANHGKLGPLQTRAERWVAAYTRIFELAKTFAEGNPKYRWTIDAPKESCESCKKLNGKIKRASYWREKGVTPKAHDKLLCRSGCKCSFVKTTERATPGPLPALP